MTICRHQRAVLGISWTRGGSTRCRVPQAISGHGKSRDTWPKGDRGIWKQDSKIIFEIQECLSPLAQVIVFMFFRQFHSKAEEHA